MAFEGTEGQVGNAINDLWVRFYRATAPELRKELGLLPFSSTPRRHPVFVLLEPFLGKEQAVARCCGTVASARAGHQQLLGANQIQTHYTYLFRDTAVQSGRVVPIGRKTRLAPQESTTSNFPEPKNRVPALPSTHLEVFDTTAVPTPPLPHIHFQLHGVNRHCSRFRYTNCAVCLTVICLFVLSISGYFIFYPRETTFCSDPLAHICI